ncbi:peptide-methionine (R)-S-oxide reductase MsrB [Tellurirhabdus rosea]|uniref:peptide-methionine (R)-S-oxide reductase MsrB n=1 Tax=Tellurirhabdus rosea TaxID=2674997 RepID=UPI0022509153|nr:peptide-methionine (R)-S-oxide reductase MsrB [Tellurirhabdus rosea]
MKTKNWLTAFLVTFVVLIGALVWANDAGLNRTDRPQDDPPGKWKVSKTNAEWKRLLTPEQYYILREKGTERAFTSPLNKNKEKGAYHCAACKTPLFASDTKFESGTGWPSFYTYIGKNVVKDRDESLGMVRDEVLCGTCGGHLGHVFDDGPKPTGLRYCINGAALEFVKK